MKTVALSSLHKIELTYNMSNAAVYARVRMHTIQERTKQEQRASRHSLPPERREIKSDRSPLCPMDHPPLGLTEKARPPKRVKQVQQKSNCCVII